MGLAEVMESRAQLMRDMAADNLRGHRKFRDSDTPACRELADWYEGRYMAYKNAAKIMRETVEVYAC